MSKITTVNDFSGGIAADIRSAAKGVSKMLKHFDISTRPRTLTPYPSQINASSSASLDQISDFLYSNSGTMYGAGVNSGGSSFTRVFSSSSFTSTTWSNIANGVSGTNQMVAGTFVEYHGFAYGLNSSGTVWKCDLTGVVAWSDDAATGALTGVPQGVQGLVHSKDDVLYLATANRISLNNNGSWTKNALVLPTDATIQCLSEYGNYLAIGCALGATGRSIVYLWDRDSTLNTLAENIDWGTGVIRVLQQVEGELIGISLRQDVNSNLQSRLVFRKYAGVVADEFASLLASSTTGLQLVLNGQKQNQRLYFLAGITIDGTLHNGVWAVGKNAAGHWIVWFDRLPNNDTAIAASSLVGFFVKGDFIYIAYNDSGYKMTMTDSNSTSYTGSSIVETVNNPDMPAADFSSNKSLNVIQVSHDKMTSGQQIILKYKTDGGSFVTVATQTYALSVSNLETTAFERAFDANGAAFTGGREFQFRVECTGGATFTCLKYKYEVLSTTI